MAGQSIYWHSTQTDVPVGETTIAEIGMLMTGSRRGA